MPLLAMPSTLKKSKFRPRLFKKRKRHSTSAANVAEWACERSPSEEVAQSDGEGHVPWEGGVKDEVEGGDVVETPEEFIEWLCGKKEQRHKMKPEAVKEDETCFRCDIFPTSSKDFAEAEKECKQLVIEAGGTIVTETKYLGGFMYTLPKDFRGAPPLETGDETLLGGYIHVTPVDPAAPLEPAEPETYQDQFHEIISAIDMDHSGNHLTTSTPVPDPVSPLMAPATTTSTTDLNPVSSLPVHSAIPTTSSESKEWPRPKDDNVTKRAGDWVKEKAAKRKAKIDEEVRAGVDKEVMSESEYEGGVEAGRLYLDGFNDLAVWMDAGGVSSG